MARIVSLTIPGVPVAKGRPRLCTGGGIARAYTPSKTRRYEDLIRLEAGRVMEGQGQIEGPIAVTIEVRLPIPKAFSKAKTAAALSGSLRPITKPDCDNFSKTIDGLNGIVWRDDAQVVDLAVSKFYSDAPSLRMTVAEVGRA